MAEMSEEESGREAGEFDGPIALSGQISNWLFWGVILGVLLLIAGTMVPVLQYPRGRGGDFARAIQNAKQIGYALYNFEDDFGSYPNDKTAKSILDSDADAFLSSAGGSNYYFSQLIAGGYVDQEAPFYANVEGVNVPDNMKNSADELLGAGEVGFAYVVWDEELDVDQLPPVAPLLMTFLEERKKGLAEPSSWFRNSKRRLIIFRADMTASALRSDSKGIVKVRNKDYFDWSQPHWGGQKPKIVWPK